MLALVAVRCGFHGVSIIWALGAVGAAGSWWSGAAAVAVVGLVCALAADSWVFRGGCIDGVDC